MKKTLLYTLFSVSLILTGCSSTKKNAEMVSTKTPFIWEGANLYFLITDRFNNGDKTQDVSFNRTKTAGKLRGFEGGDIKGLYMDDGYLFLGNTSL